MSDVAKFQLLISSQFDRLGLNSCFPVPSGADTAAFSRSFASVFVGTFVLRTNVRSILQTDIVDQLANAFEKSELFGPKEDGSLGFARSVTVQNYPRLSVIIASQKPFQKIPVARLHSFIWNCIDASVRLISNADKIAVLKEMLDFLSMGHALVPAVKDGEFFPDHACKETQFEMYTFAYYLKTALGLVQIGVDNSGKNADDVFGDIFVVPKNFFSSRADQGNFWTRFFTALLMRCVKSDKKVRVIVHESQKEFFSSDQGLTIFGRNHHAAEETIDEIRNSPGPKIDFMKEKDMITSIFFGDDLTEVMTKSKENFELLTYTDAKPFVIVKDASSDRALVVHDAYGMFEFHELPAAEVVDDISVTSGLPSAILDSDYLTGLCELQMIRDIEDDDGELLHFKPPTFGFTWLKPNGLIIWTNGNGLLVDPPIGMSPKLPPGVNRILLTSPVCDQNTCISNLVFMSERRFVILSTKAIYNDWRTRVMLLFNKDPNDFCSFVPVPLEKPFSTGLAEITFYYSFSYTPALSFFLKFRDMTFSMTRHSIYNSEIIKKAIADGVMSEERGNMILRRSQEGDYICCKAGFTYLPNDEEMLSHDFPENIRDRCFAMSINYASLSSAEKKRVDDMLHRFNGDRMKFGFKNTTACKLSEFEEGFKSASEMLEHLCSSFLLRKLTPPELFRVYYSLSPLEFENGTIIVKSSAPAIEAVDDDFLMQAPNETNTLYLIFEGKVNMLSKGSVISVLSVGDMFGNFTDSTVDIVAKTDVKVFSLPASVLSNLSVVGRCISNTVHYQSYIHSAFSKSTLFKSLSAEQYSVFSSCVSEQQMFEKGEFIIHQGDTVDKSAFIIQKGLVKVSARIGNPSMEIEFARLGSGNLVGEMAVVLDQPRSADVIALERTVVFVIDKSSFDEVMSKYPNILFVVKSLAEQRQIDLRRAGELHDAPAPRRRADSRIHKKFALPSALHKKW